MPRSKPSIIPALTLIAFGLWLLLHHWIRFSVLWLKLYPVLIVVFSCVLFWEFFRNRRHDALFWGTTLLVIGLFFILRNNRWIPYFFLDEYWPIFLMAMGAGFMARFLAQPREWGHLILAVLFPYLALTFSGHTLFPMLGDHLEETRRFWPIFLILIGVGLMCRGLQKDK